jgi:riboflavin kinase / FMN adenylyltransferase
MKHFGFDPAALRALGPTVLTIGNFDGVHRGHQFVLSRLTAVAAERNLPAVALTFSPHPVKVLNPDKDFHLVMPFSERERLIARVGVDALVTVPFTLETSTTPAAQWVRDVLVDALQVTYLLIGYDFSFGRGRDGDSGHLRRLGEELGFAIEQVPAIEEDERPISSSRVRRLIQAGEAEKVTALLGRPFHLRGAVAHGDGRGRKLGFSTANLETEWEMLPHIGVYSAVAVVDQEVHAAAVSVGRNPTFGLHELRVEAHLLDFTGDLYGKEVTLHFVRRLRDEKKFNDVQQLIDEMHHDVKRTRDLFGGRPPELWLT